MRPLPLLALLLAAPAAAVTAPETLTVFPAIPIPGDLLPSFDAALVPHILGCFERIALPAGGRLEADRPLKHPQAGVQAATSCELTARNNGVGQDLELRVRTGGREAEWVLGLDAGQPERFLFGGKTVVHETAVEWRFASCGAVMCGEVRQLLGSGPRGEQASLFKPNAEGELRPEGFSRDAIRGSLDELFVARDALRAAAGRLRGKLARAAAAPGKSAPPGGTREPERESRRP